MHRGTGRTPHLLKMLFLVYDYRFVFLLESCRGHYKHQFWSASFVDFTDIWCSKTQNKRMRIHLNLVHSFGYPWRQNKWCLAKKNSKFVQNSKSSKQFLGLHCNWLGSCRPCQSIIYYIPVLIDPSVYSLHRSMSAMDMLLR